MDYKVRYHPRKKQLVIDVYEDNGRKFCTYVEDNPTLDTVEQMEYATKEDIRDYLKTSVSYYVKN